MVHQGLAPGVQHGDEADISAEMLRVGGDGPEGSCGGSEQGAVDFRVGCAAPAAPALPAGVKTTWK